MQRLTEKKIIVVTREARLGGLLRRFNTRRQAKFYVEHLGGDFSDYTAEQDTYQAAIEQTDAALRPLGLVQFIDRAFLPNFIFGPEDTVVVLGQDGLVANTLKYTGPRPVVGVNPDPKAFRRRAAALSRARPGDDHARDAGQPPPVQARDDGQGVAQRRAHALRGERFLRRPALARFRALRHPHGRRQETHSSSGVIVSTGLGSTGWLKSSAHRRGRHFRARPRGSSAAVPERPPLPPMGWDADYLYFTVREPFPSRTTAATLVFGAVTAREPLRLTSQMAENGVIFSDGIEADFLEFNSGAEAQVGVAERKGQLVF